MAGKVRSIKTLSGGQTFQAALSMALALADSIQHFTNPSQNFFFLDEGFGSLDKESLEVVFETLKSLRKENRIVGVISHVEEMQQEIDTHLRIINGEENGSRVFESWKKMSPILSFCEFFSFDPLDWKLNLLLFAKFFERGILCHVNYGCQTTN